MKGSNEEGYGKISMSVRSKTRDKDGGCRKDNKYERVEKEGK